MKLYQNKVKLTINGKEFTNNIPFPIKWNELLDNQLDEMSIELLQVQDRTFKPLSEVTVEIWNEGTPNNKIVNNYMVASDNANEIPSGSGKFNHSLSLIERTKWLERFVCRSQGYVNSLAKSYVQAPLVPVVTQVDAGGVTQPEAKVYGTILGPQPIQTTVEFPSWYELTGLNSGNDSLYEGTYANYVELVNSTNNQVIALTRDRNQRLSVNIESPGVYLFGYRTYFYSEVDGIVIEMAEYYILYYVVFI